jgi:hypothetical protein
MKRAEVRVDGEYDYAIFANSTIIAEVFGRAGQTVFPPAAANARLIAKAPEMLAVLRGILDNQSPLGDGYTQVCTLDVEAAERIIAEIEGEES